MAFHRPSVSIDFLHVLNLYRFLTASDFQGNLACSTFGPGFSEGLILYRFWACANIHMIFHRPWFSIDFLHVRNLHRCLAASAFLWKFTRSDFGSFFVRAWFPTDFLHVQTSIWVSTVHDFRLMFCMCWICIDCWQHQFFNENLLDLIFDDIFLRVWISKDFLHVQIL